MIDHAVVARLVAGQLPAPQLVSFVPLILIFVIFYFLVIAPARKRQKKLQQTIDALKRGDRVVTTGGIYGEVVSTEGGVIFLKVADNVRLKMAKSAIAGLEQEEPEVKRESEPALAGPRGPGGGGRVHPARLPAGGEDQPRARPARRHAPGARRPGRRRAARRDREGHGHAWCASSARTASPASRCAASRTAVRGDRRSRRAPRRGRQGGRHLPARSGPSPPAPQALVFTRKPEEDNDIREQAVQPGPADDRQPHRRLRRRRAGDPASGPGLEPHRAAASRRRRSRARQGADQEHRAPRVPLRRLPAAGRGGVGGRDPAALQRAAARRHGDLPAGSAAARTARVAGTVFVALEKRRIITGRDLRTARPGLGQFNEPVVRFYLSKEAGKVFGEATGANIGRRLAIVLDGKVQSAPVVQGRIQDEGVIEGQFTQTEVEDLVTVLRSGALPASIVYLEERAVGPVARAGLDRRRHARVAARRRAGAAADAGRLQALRPQRRAGARASTSSWCSAPWPTSAPP